MGWTQGEQDASNGTGADAYIATVAAGRQAVETYAQGVVGRPLVLPMIMSQLATFNFYNKPATIALAQSQMCRDDPLMIMTIPRYQLAYASDGLHITGPSSKTMGSYEGYAASELLLNKRKIKPVDIIDSWRSGNDIVLEYAAERGPLVFDTSFVSDPGGLGFTVTASDGSALTIGTPIVYGGRYVRIPVTARAPIAGDIVKYGINGTAVGGPTTGSRGCLRDSAKLPDGSSLTYNLNDGNGDRPMHFYALISQTVLT